MKFETAMDLLKKGNKITRPSWDKNSYWELGKQNPLKDIICWSDGSVARIRLNQLKATDWEVYKSFTILKVKDEERVRCIIYLLKSSKYWHEVEKNLYKLLEK